MSLINKTRILLCKALEVWGRDWSGSNICVKPLQFKPLLYNYIKVYIEPQKKKELEVIAQPEHSRQECVYDVIRWWRHVWSCSGLDTFFFLGLSWWCRKEPSYFIYQVGPWKETVIVGPLMYMGAYQHVARSKSVILNDLDNKIVSP